MRAAAFALLLIGLGACAAPGGSGADIGRGRYGSGYDAL